MKVWKSQRFSLSTKAKVLERKGILSDPIRPYHAYTPNQLSSSDVGLFGIANSHHPSLGITVSSYYLLCLDLMNFRYFS